MLGFMQEKQQQQNIFRALILCMKKYLLLNIYRYICIVIDVEVFSIKGLVHYSENMSIQVHVHYE